MGTDKSGHILKTGHGLHTNLGGPQGNWNAVWESWIEGDPDATTAQVLHKLASMVDDSDVRGKLGY